MARPPTCRAVVASRHGYGTILWSVGHFSFDEFLSNTGRDLGDLGLDDAPDGIHVWEGRMESGWGDDGDLDLEGTFRSPTDDEWNAIRQNRSPWPGIQIDLLDQSCVGEWVVHTDRSGKKEHGTISSWNQSFVFVQYGNAPPAQATIPEQLEWEEP